MPGEGGCACGKWSAPDPLGELRAGVLTKRRAVSMDCRACGASRSSGSSAPGAGELSDVRLRMFILPACEAITLTSFMHVMQSTLARCRTHPPPCDPTWPVRTLRWASQTSPGHPRAVGSQSSIVSPACSNLSTTPRIGTERASSSASQPPSQPRFSSSRSSPPHPRPSTRACTPPSSAPTLSAALRGSPRLHARPRCWWS